MLPVESSSPLQTQSPKNNAFVSTPCRRMGLKRKSIGSPLHSEVMKKTKCLNEAKTAAKNLLRASIQITKGSNSTNLTDSSLTIKSKIIDKQNKIKELGTELKNSEQHNLFKIQKLSEKWLRVCQEALKSLFEKLKDSSDFNGHSLEDLIKHLGIDPILVKYDCHSQDFI
ncbi:uncharacterized protein LOC126842725 [Adelges cooleyi]|uniref:uncharacterized protein LOC126842725 n=1 Tax=Adelges cooleyi TaxID=133065 RepID=UPI00217F620D|nr:uncharacterized protein LOC126842725 [Adelges cooleyi]